MAPRQGPALAPAPKHPGNLAIFFSPGDYDLHANNLQLQSTLSANSACVPGQASAPSEASLRSEHARNSCSALLAWGCTVKEGSVTSPAEGFCILDGPCRVMLVYRAARRKPAS